MARPRKSTADATPRPAEPRKPTDRANTLTRERLNEHLDAFQAAGGKIEVLGTTRSLQRIQTTPESPPAATTTTPPAKRTR